MNQHVSCAYIIVVPYIGTWIETEINDINEHVNLRRTLYRYVD